MLTFRYSCLVVRDVPAAVEFYGRAFGFALHFMHPSRGYAELETGSTLLAFFGEAFVEDTRIFGALRPRLNRADLTPMGAVTALVTDDMERDWARAVAAGATLVAAPEPKPWGQTVGYLRDPDGCLIEICTRSPRG